MKFKNSVKKLLILSLIITLINSVICENNVNSTTNETITCKTPELTTNVPIVPINQTTEATTTTPENSSTKSPPNESHVRIAFEAFKVSEINQNFPNEITKKALHVFAIVCKHFTTPSAHEIFSPPKK
jgi:hypothetical protein